MINKAYSTISPHSPQKIYITPLYIFSIRPGPLQKLRGGQHTGKTTRLASAYGARGHKAFEGLEYKDELD